MSKKAPAAINRQYDLWIDGAERPARDDERPAVVDPATTRELANDTDYGLAAGVYTDNAGRAHYFAREVDAGQVYVNEYYAGGNETPFGGFKKTGIGRENGVQAIENYTQTKNVYANIGRR
jgi:acyl-CoA reductase-like NAD-dependent aldehyde dehydrogenase